MMSKSSVFVLWMVAYLTVHCLTQLPSCSNLYTPTFLPSYCTQTTLSCLLPPLSNSSLITNSTTETQYELCLDLPQYDLTITGTNDFIQMSLYINCNSLTLNEGYSLLSLHNIVIIANQTISLNTNSLTGKLMWLQADTLGIDNSTISNPGEFKTSCNCLAKGSICTPPDYFFPFLYGDLNYYCNYTQSLMNYSYSTWPLPTSTTNSLILQANTSITLFNSTLQLSVIAVYTPTLTLLNSTLNTDGLGYPSGTGIGCGYFDQVLNQLLGCTGSGGSYGGYGGNSGPQNCNLLVSNAPYGRQYIPRFPGSGGGFFLRQITSVSAGGGIINIQTYTLSLVSSNLSANGMNGIQGGGGGSGGSISIDFMEVANLTGMSYIMANGGNGKSSGGGGRIRLYDQNWSDRNGQLSTSQVLVSAVAGGGCLNRLSCGENGGVIAAPCTPGYQLNLKNYACTFCPTGSYQVLPGYSLCAPCDNKPTNSYYSFSATSTSTLSSYKEVCIFSCNNSSTVYRLYQGRECLTSLEYLFADVGGIDLLICISIIIATIIIFLVIMMIRKLSLTDNNSPDQIEDIDYYKKQSYFKLEDIPFHVIRIYFQGNNHTNNPWNISVNVERKLGECEEYETRLMFFSRLFHDLNDICSYSRLSHYLLLTLKIVYYPLALFLSAILRQKKAKLIRNQLIIKSKKQVQSKMGIKLHVNQEFTIGCLQIFNFNKQTLDFYIKNYFPLYFKLHKLAIGGYSLDFTDPLLKALCTEFEENEDKRLEDHLLELNQYLRHSDHTLNIFKYLWKINYLWPALQCYLWQPDNKILGIDGKFTIDQQVDLFVVFSTEGKDQSQMSNPNINLSIPYSADSMQQCRQGENNKHSRHFLYNQDLPNIYLDEISCIRHKYHLREAMIEMQEKKTMFWQIENNFQQKFLSWSLGIMSIVLLLLNLLSFFMIIFLLVDGSNILLYSFVPYFVIFPFCEFFMVFLEFSLVISKGSRIFSFTLYFSVFCVCKFLVLTIILLALAISNGFDDVILLTLFFIWLAIFLFDVLSLITLCMLYVHYTKAK